jgi:AraC family transcriptional regulator
MRHLRSERAEFTKRLMLLAGTEAQLASSVEVVAELELAKARAELVTLDHRRPSEYKFRQEDVFWVDLCLTPRLPLACARYVDRWDPHHFAEMGAIIALPPGQLLQLKSPGGRHSSLICQVKSEAVYKWLPDNFEWTDRRLEASLYIANETIRGLLLRMAQELRHPKVASEDLCQAIVAQLSIELARHLVAVSEPIEKGGLASWRLRTIDKRLAEPREPPMLKELANLCKISVRQLTRGFRTCRGCSIGDYVAQSRIEAAKRRLATDESLKAIASSLGFSSPSNFASAFRRASGATPSDYRNRMLRITETAGDDA